MRPLRLRLKPGADPAGAVGVLGSLIVNGRNVIASVGGGTLVGPGAVPLAEAFVSWVENIELQLSALSFDDDLIDALHTERYWRIRQLHEEPIRPVALVQAEIDRQTRWLTALRQDLQTRSGKPHMLVACRQFLIPTCCWNSCRQNKWTGIPSSTLL
jgi:hypothetical protein